MKKLAESPPRRGRPPRPLPPGPDCPDAATEPACCIILAIGFSDCSLPMTRHPELPERDRRILGTLVQAYIEHAEPISSLWLASQGFGVSSATLRNVMARLEEMGYVRQPHTSAGRVPTDMGYRSYVDQLMADRRGAR